MSEKKEKIIEAIGKEIPGMTEKDKTYLMGFLEGLAAILSRKCGKEITVTVTPPAQDERAARPARNRGKSDQRVSA